MKKNNEKPLIGFFPLTFNLAETGRAILVAKRYVDMGGKALFFSHGGTYEHLIKDFEFDFIRIKPIFNEETVKHIISVNRREKKGVPYSVSFLREAVKEEINVFKKSGVKLIVSFHNLASSISARSAGIPLICVTPAAGNFYMKIPDNYENFFMRIIPQKIKVPVINYLFNHSKTFLAPFNIVAKEFNVKPFKSTISLGYGDKTLGTTFFNFINIFPKQQQFPKQDYVGIILLEELFSDCFSKDDYVLTNDKIQKHLESKQKKVLFTMGSSGDKKLFLNVIKALAKVNCSTIAVYANILKEDELPKNSDKLLLLKFVPSIKKLHELVDLSIIHGGQGTVYSAAYSGKPIIGIPMNPEQHLNLEKMVGHKTGLMISKKFFKEQTFINLIHTIFNNYNFYLKNAENLKIILPKPQGDKNAVKRIIEIIDELQVQ
ncbi:MAG: hypothetical protein JSV67_01085 [Thermoplasmatales archaeon]|nr:MAG: hypothetical protein JSV67_01085 [Thermoplasmatales archaeon]